MNVISALLKTMYVIIGKKFYGRQISQIYSGFREYGLSIQQVKTYAKSEIRSSKMRMIKRAFVNGATFEDVEYFDWFNLSPYITSLIAEGYYYGLSTTEIDTYAKTNIRDVDAYVIFVKLKQQKR